MAKRKKARDQQTVQEDAIVQELLVELQEIEEQRQCAVRLHQLMDQHCHLEIPVQFERLFRRFPPRPAEFTHDHRRGTQKSRRRRLSHSRV
jgi:hypothetical protein